MEMHATEVVHRGADDDHVYGTDKSLDAWVRQRAVLAAGSSAVFRMLEKGSM